MDSVTEEKYHLVDDLIKREAQARRAAHDLRVLRQRLHALGIHDPDIHALIIRILLDLEEGL